MRSALSAMYRLSQYGTWSARLAPLDSTFQDRTEKEERHPHDNEKLDLATRLGISTSVEGKHFVSLAFMNYVHALNSNLVPNLLAQPS